MDPLIALLLVILFPFATSTDATATFVFDPVQNVTLSQSESLLYSFAFPHKKKLAQLLLNVSRDVDVSISENCRQSLINFSYGLDQNEANSLLMLDSFSKMKPGLFSYQFTDFGHYSQCLTKSNPVARYVVLQVDFIDFRDTKNFLDAIGERHFAYHKPLLAICVPGTCTQLDVSSVFSSKSVHFFHPYKLTLFTSQVKGEDQFTDHSYLKFISRLVLVSVVSMSLLCTLLVNFSPEIFSKNPVIYSFDIFKNTQNLFRFKVNPIQRQTQFFCGVRSIFLFFSIHGHHFIPMSPASKPYFHSIIQSIYMWTPLLKLTQLASLLTLFNLILSSALNVITWNNNLNHSQSGNKLSLFKYIFYRTFRVYPTILASFLLIASFAFISNSGGPLMNYTQKVSIDLLINHGWKQLLFISSFQPVDQMILPIGWFISADMQLYLASFLIVRFMIHKPKIGLYLALLTIPFGLIVHWIYLSTSNASPTLHVPTTRFHLNEQLFQVVYINTINYISSYAIGLILGYLIAHRIVIRRKWQRIILITSLVTLGIALPLPGLIYDSEGFTQINRTLELIAGVTLKPIVCAASCGIFYWLWLNPSNLLARFLSHSIFVILSRLSLCAFVLHPIQIIFLFASDSEAKVYDFNEIIIRTLFTLISCLFYSFWLFVLVESPFFELRHLFTKSRVNDNSNIDCDNNNKNKYNNNVKDK